MSICVRINIVVLRRLFQFQNCNIAVTRVWGFPLRRDLTCETALRAWSYRLLEGVDSWNLDTFDGLQYNKNRSFRIFIWNNCTFLRMRAAPLRSGTPPLGSRRQNRRASSTLGIFEFNFFFCFVCFCCIDSLPRSRTSTSTLYILLVLHEYLYFSANWTANKPLWHSILVYPDHVLLWVLLS